MQGKNTKRPPVQRPMILDVLPADIAPRLDKRQDSFNKKLIKHVPKPLRKWLLPILAVVIIAGVIGVWQPWRPAGAKLPPAIAKQVNGFVPYYFAGSLPKGYKVNERQMSYSDGVLFFEVKDPKNQTIVVSEQTLPASFSNITPRGDQTITDVDGQGVISKREGRTIGTVITGKEPRALISLNAAESVGAVSMTQIMQALTPASTK